MIGPGLQPGNTIGAGGGAGATLTTKLADGPDGRTIGGDLLDLDGNWTTSGPGTAPGATTSGVGAGMARVAATVGAGPRAGFGRPPPGYASWAAMSGAEPFNRGNRAANNAGLMSLSELGGGTIGGGGQGGGRYIGGGHKGGGHKGGRHKGGGHKGGGHKGGGHKGGRHKGGGHMGGGHKGNGGNG